MVALSRFRHCEPSFADLLPYAAMVDDAILLLKDGSLLAAWYFAGPDSESSTNLERNRISQEINDIICGLGSGWMLQVDSMWLPSAAYFAPDRSHFPDPVSRAIDAERRQHFESEKRHYQSRHALVLTYKPQERAGERRGGEGSDCPPISMPRMAGRPIRRPTRCLQPSPARSGRSSNICRV